MLIWGVIALIIFAVSFLNTEWGLYVLILSMLLSPEIIAGETAGSSLGRGVTLRLEDFLLVIIGASWFAKNAVHKELGLFLKTPLNRPIIVYVLACVLATGFGIITGNVNPKTGFFFTLKYFEYFIVYFMLINHVSTKEQVNRFVICLFLTCFITTLIALTQIPGGERISAPFEGERGEPNTYGGYLLFIGAMAGGLFFYLKNLKIRLLLIIIVVFIIPPLLFTQSRTSYLGVVPVCIALGLLTEKKVITTGIIILSLVATPLFLPSIVKERILFTVAQPKEGGQVSIGKMHLDTSTSARLYSWQEAFKGWTRRPVFGYGVTGFGFVDAQFPRVLSETGIIGLGAFIYLLYAIWKLAVDNLKKLKTPYYRGLTVGFIVGYVGLLFHAIGANTFIIVRIMEPFWFFLGIIFVLPELEREESATDFKELNEEAYKPAPAVGVKK